MFSLSGGEKAGAENGLTRSASVIHAPTKSGVCGEEVKGRRAVVVENAPMFHLHSVLRIYYSSGICFF